MHAVVCASGAFDGLDKVIRARSEKGGIGFGAEVKSRDNRKDMTKVLRISFETGETGFDPVRVADVYSNGVTALAVISARSLRDSFEIETRTSKVVTLSFSTPMGEILVTLPENFSSLNDSTVMRAGWPR